jgi:hypothetical protein
MVQRNARTVSLWADEERIADLAVHSVLVDLNVSTMLSNAVVCVSIFAIGMNNRKHAICDWWLKVCAH